MKKSNLYTKTGDEGTTSLVGGMRIAKNDPRIEAYGTVDELNAHLGYLTTLLPTDVHEADILHRIQSALLTLGSYLATDQQLTPLNPKSLLSDQQIELLEREIDFVDEGLPALHGFILPGGCPESAFCQVCRTVCRRAERRILELQKQAEVSNIVLRYMNRLSDYLFVLSRKLNNDKKNEEINW